MAPGTLFGLVVIAGGILILIVSRFLTNVAASSRAYLQPDLDKAAFKRRNLRILRFMAAAWFVIGAGIAIFGLMTGR
jgi:hypothetical protein